MTTGRHSVLNAAICLFFVFGCRQKMADQPRYEPFESAPFFRDSMAVRHPVPGTVPRESALQGAFRSDHVHSSDEEHIPIERFEAPGAGVLGEDDSETASSSAVQGGFPFPVTEDVLQRGRNRYDIYCSPCHGRDGYGMGIIVRRGLRRPPSFHTERLRSAPPDHFYSVITDGFGSMYSYASRVAPADRWAIAAYIQALQLSQHAAVDAFPADTLARPEAP